MTSTPNRMSNSSPSTARACGTSNSTAASTSTLIIIFLVIVSTLPSFLIHIHLLYHSLSSLSSQNLAPRKRQML
ncbi:MAG: hypothetical protein LBM98_09750 [Oscillospiraceae bacterium]|nr:hypothetical protein [Oscillospiraceae bacterium]